MPVPTQYSESLFSDYLFSVLGEVGGMLGWTAGSPAVQEALTDALLEYGETTIANIVGTDGIKGTNALRRLRALGRRAIWRAVVQATAGKYSIGTADGRLDRAKLQENALAALALAENDCIEWDPKYAVSIVSVNRPSDPYIVLPDSQRVP